MVNKLCIIVPVRGGAIEFKRCLGSILGLDYSNLEIMVVDDGLEEEGLKVLGGVLIR